MPPATVNEPIPVPCNAELSRQGFAAGQERARAALARQVDLHPRRSRAAANPAAAAAESLRARRNRKPEDTAEGCRARADADRAEAAAMGGDRLRFRLERSADAWTARADLLQRLRHSEERD